MDPPIVDVIADRRKKFLGNIDRADLKADWKKVDSWSFGMFIYFSVISLKNILPCFIAKLASQILSTKSTKALRKRWLTIGSLHRQVAVLVPDEKLNC